jgi:hypothetical protein
MTLFVVGRSTATVLALLVDADDHLLALPVEALEDAAAPKVGGEPLELLTPDVEGLTPRGTVGQRNLRDLEATAGRTSENSPTRQFGE